MHVICHLNFPLLCETNCFKVLLSDVHYIHQSKLMIYAHQNLVGLLVQTGAGSQSQEQSSSVPAALRNFSLSQKERTLEELVQDRWLYLSADNKIGLGIRSFLDLRSWFRSNDIPSCEVCNEAAVKVILHF